jgi:hypothetical protein
MVALPVLVSGLEAEMVRLGYKDSTLAWYRGAWRRLQRYFAARGDELFELTDAVLCADGPVATLVGLSLAPEHRRGRGALYGGLCCGRVSLGRLRWALACLPLPRWPDGRIVLAADVSQPGPAVLSRARPGQGTDADDPGLAVLGGGRAGARPHQLDRDAGCGPARPGR